MIFNKGRYVCIKQHDTTDCAAACLASIAKFYGLSKSIAQIRQIAGTDREGTNIYGIVKAAEQIGMTAKAVKGDKESLFSDFSLPAIAHVIKDDSLLHYLVIYKISKKDIIVSDPAEGIKKYTPDDFMKIWTGVLILLMPTVKFQKGNENQGVLKRFFVLLIPQRKLIINICMASFILTIFGIMGAFFFQILLDDILPNNLENTLNILCIGLIILGIFKVLLNAFREQLLLYLSQRLDIPLLLQYYNHVLKLPMHFFGTRKTGEIISRFEDASHIKDAISSTALTIMLDTIMVIVGGAILYFKNQILFFITIIMVLIYIGLVMLFKKPFEEYNRKIMEADAQLTSYLVESISGIETLKSNNAEETAVFKTEKGFIDILKKTFRISTLGNIQGSIRLLVEIIGEIAILWVGAYKILHGELTIGELIVFNSLLVYFLDPVENLIGLQPTLQTAMVAAERLSEILDLNIEKNENEEEKIKPETLQGGIEFRNVDFRYGTRELVLKNINLFIQPGKTTALVGESGSGKTTIAKLLLNFYNLEKGEILINGINIKDMNIEALREKVAYVSQDVFLFSDTIKNNLTLGNSDVTFEEIVNICQEVKAHDFINRLPLRYDTVLEEGGESLSGGERQRLVIARALLRKPDIFIFDEATSNLDSITEKALSYAIKNTTEHSTVLIIAHRLSTIMKCDNICVLEKGEIIETGTHKELLSKKGKYYNLWKEQLSEEI